MWEWKSFIRRLFAVALLWTTTVHGKGRIKAVDEYFAERNIYPRCSELTKLAECLSKWTETNGKSFAANSNGVADGNFLICTTPLRGQFLCLVFLGNLHRPNQFWMWAERATKKRGQFDITKHSQNVTVLNIDDREGGGYRL